MDPNTTQTTATPTPTGAVTSMPEEQPERLLTMLRGIATPEPAPAPKPAAVSPEPVPTPQAKAPVPDKDVMRVLPTAAQAAQKANPATPTAANDVPSLADLRGERPAHDPIAPTQSMEVFRPTFTKGLKMDDITINQQKQSQKQSDGITYDTQPTKPESSGETKRLVQESSSPNKIPSMHTLRDDMRNIVSNQSISVVKATAMEQDKRARTAKPQEAATPQEVLEKAAQAEPKKKRGFPVLLSVSLALLIIGGAALGGFFFYRSLEQSPLTLPEETRDVIFTEASQQLPIDNTSPSFLKQTLDTSFRNNTALGIGSVVRIVPSMPNGDRTREATLSEFMSALGVSMPIELQSTLGPEYFLGIHAQSGNHFVLIIPTTSYEQSFAGMVRWEPSMGSALSPLFPGVPNTIIDEEGIIQPNTFSDVVVRNVDVRMIADDKGLPKLFYTFPNRELLVITSDQYTLIESLARLQAALTRTEQ